MKSVRALTGMPVILTTTGARAGRVVRAAVDERLTRLDGVWVANKLGKTAYCASEDIEMLGNVAVLARKLGGRKPRGILFRPRRALDASGALIGAVLGAYAWEESLAIACVELSHGFWEDIARGRQLVRQYAVRLPEGDVLIRQEGEDEREERMDSGDDRGRDAGRFGGDRVWDDELAGRAEAGPRGGERGQDDFRKSAELV